MCSSLVFSQEKTNGTITNTSVSLLENSNIKKSNIINLQEYIENLYINSSKFYNNGALPSLKEGQYNVVLIDDFGNNSYKKSSDFKDISSDYVEYISYDKSPKENALYGDFGDKFGIITIKLKKK